MHMFKEYIYSILIDSDGVIHKEMRNLMHKGLIFLRLI